MHEVPVHPLAVEPLEPVIGPARFSELCTAVGSTQELLGDRVVWNVNSTGAGGGVAEMLARVLGYFEGAGIPSPWLVVDGDDEFFALTKRLHHTLHGMPGDGGPLGRAERRHYHRVQAANTGALLARVRPGDVAVLHDPQVLGLAPVLRQAGATVIWRCHIGADATNAHTEQGWSFLRPDLGAVDAFVFSRLAYAPPGLEAPVHVMPPTIDPNSAKNRPVDDVIAASVLEPLGIPAGAPLVVQVSRWDPLKDPGGLIEAFRHVDDGACHLVVAGPEPDGVADDPEASGVLADCTAAWQRLPADRRPRVHLASLPMADIDANALMVNALQGQAAVVVQKSLAEGFGLTVTEALWKGRPVLASKVGGIPDQVVHGRHGWLLDDPGDATATAAAIDRLLEAPEWASRLGEAGRQRVRHEFLDDRQLRDWGGLFEALVPGRRSIPA